MADYPECNPLSFLPFRVPITVIEKCGSLSDLFYLSKSINSAFIAMMMLLMMLLMFNFGSYSGSVREAV